MTEIYKNSSSTEKEKSDKKSEPDNATIQNLEKTERYKKEKNKKGLSIGFTFEKAKYLFYSAILYSCALAVGSAFYKAVTSDTLDNLLMPKTVSFVNLFLSTACLYMALFLIIIFLGFSLAGYPVMNVIPIFLGLEYGIKISYYLINYSAKGTVYSILMIIPFVSLFLTIIIYTIRISTDMSKSLLKLAKKEGSSRFEIKPYLKKYSIMGFSLLIAALASAAVQTALYNIVNL